MLKSILSSSTGQIVLSFVLVIALFVGINAMLPAPASTGTGAQNEVGQEAAESTAVATEAPTPAPTPEPVPRVYFKQPTDNAVVPTTFTAEFGVENLILAEAGSAVAGAGHLQLLVDAPFTEVGSVAPMDESHVHLAEGQTSVELTLSEGEHVLRLQFTDGNHLPLEGAQYRAEAHIFVQADAPAQSVRIVSPTNGATVPTTFNLVMAVAGIAVEPAGEAREGAGHLHVLVDQDFIPAGEVIPRDETHLHFGKGQVSTELTLTAGTHTIRLQLADGMHTALDGDQYRAEITVTVAEGAPAQAVSIISPANGDTVPATFTLQMAVAGLLVEGAGTARDGAGHLHVLVDQDFIPAGQVIPRDETHLHFGKGQLSTELTLTAGTHTIRLQFADGTHTALEGDQYRAEITVTVGE